MAEEKKKPDYFADNKSDLDKIQERSNAQKGAENMGIVEYPGKFLCRVREFIGKDKPAKGRYVAPTTYTSEKGQFMLNVVFEVIDGTPHVPAKALLFHLQTLLPAPDADETKANNTLRFMKPVVKALTGLEGEVPITEEFFKTLTIDVDGNYKVIRHHKMDRDVICVVEEAWSDKMKKWQYRVKYINRANPNDKSIEGDRSKDAAEWFAKREAEAPKTEQKPADPAPVQAADAAAVKEKVAKINLDAAEQGDVTMEDM